MQKHFMQNTSCNACKQGATKNEQSRRNCEIKQQFLWAVTFIFVTETKIIFLWWRHNKKKKKIKVRGFTYFT
jgi:hypothetical protein